MGLAVAAEEEPLVICQWVEGIRTVDEPFAAAEERPYACIGPISKGEQKSRRYEAHAAAPDEGEPVRLASRYPFADTHR